jgi:hypothetical protein
VKTFAKLAAALTAGWIIGGVAAIGYAMRNLNNEIKTKRVK